MEDTIKITVEKWDFKYTIEIPQSYYINNLLSVFDKITNQILTLMDKEK